MSAGFDKLGLPLAVVVASALWFLPFVSSKANRIVPGEPQGLLNAVPLALALPLLLIVLAIAALGALRLSARTRLPAAFLALVCLLTALGLSPSHLASANNPYARVAPASGFWVAVLAFALLATDALSRTRPGPAARLVLLVAVLAGGGVLLSSGFFDGLSVMKEYASRQDTFWREGARHLALAFGSMGIAVAIGIPFAVAAHRLAPLRGPVLGVLNIVQTIPSIALFGLLIAPLGWIAINVPGAYEIGVRGIGAAPALVALVLYSLLPVVANTLAGFAAVPDAARDAARGIGMTRRQRLFAVEFPLALPVILAGIRIVLVQNIGLATIAALIGGGGFGVFVFQGLGQNATDLVLLGALPTVLLAFASAIVLDAAIDFASIRRERSAP